MLMGAVDIDLARTFLEIVRSGSFIAAGEKLHVTQTAVTARVRNLEGQLGCRLFVRNRSGATLTPDDERFVAHASQLVRTWKAARRELPMPKGADTLLTLGGETSLWNPLLLQWLSALRSSQETAAVRVEVGGKRKLHDKVDQGVMDAVLVHQPDYRPGIQVEQLLEEKLVQVRSVRCAVPYLYVDWGEHFCRQHDTALPELARSALYADLGPLALEYLLQQGGRGYFRSRVVQPYLEQGLTERVPAAPEFSYPVYLIYLRERWDTLSENVFPALKTAMASY